MPFIHTAYTNLQLRFHKDAAKKGWVTERKVQAQFVVSSPWMRYQCDIVEGKSKKPDRRLADQLDRELHAFARTNWRRKAKRHANKAFAITTRALALGHIQDLTDPQTSTQWVRIWILAYTIGYAAGKIMMGPDLELSNFDELSIVYYAPGYELDIKGFQNSYGLLCDLWGGPVMITTYPGLPQAVWIRPVATAPEGEVALEQLSTDRVSLGTSLKNKDHEIGFAFDEFDDVYHMVIVGQPGSGKTVLTQNMCLQFLRMRQHVEHISYIDPGGGAGMRKMAEFEGFTLANSIEKINAEMARLEQVYAQRSEELIEKDWAKWKGPLWVVILDETPRLLKHRDINGKRIELWPLDFRKYGMWIICITQDATEKTATTAFWGAFNWKIMFHVDQMMAPSGLFKRDKGQFDTHPFYMTQGQFVMNRPNAMTMEYGLGHAPMIPKLFPPDVDD
jgi:hypothetical protein